EPARGATIKGIQLNQAVAIPLMRDGNAVTQQNAPIVAGRAALVRVFVDPGSARGTELVAKLELDGGRAAKCVKLTPNGASSDADLGSTFNFEIGGDALSGKLGYAVTLLSAQGGGSGSRFPASGTASIDTASTNGPLEIVLVPYRYRGDGSGRTP